MKKKLLIALACIVSVIGVLCGIYLKDSEINNTIDTIQNIIIDEINKAEDVVVSEQTKELVIQTKEAIQNDKDIATTETIESTEQEEQNITDESALENDATVEQENISYDGDNSGKGLSLLGTYQGLTYYSQADSRWANIMYSSIGDTSQTMKSSACGPTSAAMIVSSSKGTILPTTMANLFVDNGYRTANNGTAWSAYSFVADYFDFNEYHTTSNFNTARSYLSQKDENGNSKYYIICSCGSGLFTTGGHYIVLVGLDNGTIQVYDPYLYNGKFTTASRRNAGVVVSGNSVFVSEDSFREYSNYKNFWIYSNDKGEGNPNNVTGQNAGNNSVSYTRYVATQSANLNVRDNPNGNRITSLIKGTQVTVVEINGDWSRITSPVNGWVSTGYLSSTSPTGEITTTTTSGMPTSGTVRVNTSLNVRTGPGTQYKYVKSLYNGNNVYIYESRNGWYRIGTNLWVCAKYVNTSNSVPSSSNYSTSIGSYYRLKYNTTLYKNGNLSGTTYSYLAKTQIKVISHYSNSIDYIYVPKTGRYAYCKVQAFK